MTSARGVRNVRALFRITQMLRAWLYEHAADYGEAFVDAFAQDIAYLRDAVCQTAKRVEAAELDAYMAGMGSAERVEFGLLRFGNDPADVRLRELSESRDYRLGHAALAIPRAVKRAAGR